MNKNEQSGGDSTAGPPGQAEGGSTGPGPAEPVEYAELAKLTGAITASLCGRGDLRSDLVGCTKAIAKHFDASGVRLWTLDPVERTLDLQASSSAPFPDCPTHRRVSLGTSTVVSRIAATGYPEMMDSVPDDCAIDDREWVRREGIAAYIGHPLEVDGQVLGVLEMFSRTPFSEDTLASLAPICGHIALGIERRLTELQLEVVGRRFHDIVDNIDEMVWIREISTQQIIYVSPAVERIWGITLHSLRELPERFLDLVHPDDLLTVVELRKSQGRNDTTFRILRPPTGEIRVLRVRIFPILDESGAVQRMVGVATDITDQQAMEERLRHSQKMDMVGQLAGGIAHDFNNLLNIILGHCDLLQARLNPADPLSPYFEAIQLAAVRSAGLVQKLLAFSKRQFLQPRPVDLSGTILEMATMLERVIGENIVMKVEAEPSLWTAVVDPDQIQQVILNLAINARDAMPAGGHLTIQLANIGMPDEMVLSQPEVPPGAYVGIIVSDTGEGMDRSVQDRIFEPFFTTKAAKGTGLGLAMVQGTIQQSGGFIRVYSEPGEGTSFRIYLPAVDGPPDAVVPVNRGLEGLRGDETILLVEDEPALLALAARMLRGCGYQVLEASSGTEALRICHEHPEPIPLLITDAVLPDMKGREVAGKVSLQRPEIKILSISGYAEERAFRKTDPPVMRSFLQKPFRTQALAGAVRELLDRGEPSVPARILIVDDDAGVRETLARMIARPEWELFHAGDGAEALAILAHQPLDVVITDLMMPNRDGLELVRAVRKQHSGVKVLVMSGQSNDTLLKACSFLGANGVLVKPIKQEAIRGAVKTLLNASGDS